MYCENNPVNYIDPSGLICIDPKTLDILMQTFPMGGIGWGRMLKNIKIHPRYYSKSAYEKFYKSLKTETRVPTQYGLKPSPPELKPWQKILLGFLETLRVIGGGQP